MSKRYKRPEEILAEPDGTTKIPTNEPIAIYYRQSSEAQIGNISTSMQTVDMVAHLKQRGWADDKIYMIDMDAGVSGSTSIDERVGMRKLFDLITEDKVKAVACQDEDRLFRDVTQIQVNIFIEVCRKANVLVITPSMVYDFANEMTGSFHARQFRFKCEMAAEYINSIIRGRLHTAKRRLIMNGQWGGAGIPPGFMVDERKTLPDGSKNENWRKFVPFKPYAEVVNEYFRLFLSFSGSVRATVRHIHAHGPYYPDPATTPPPTGFRFVYRMHRYGNGYCPGRNGLAALVTNAAYIGHWAVNKAIVKWHNHEPIVPEDVFMEAFNHVSKTTLDGRPNPHYRPYQEHARPAKEEERGVERPLCAGMMVSLFNDKWRNVGTNWISPQKHYAYVLWGQKPVSEYVWSKAAKYVDDAVVRLVHRKLTATFDPKVWEQTIRDFEKNFKKECQRKQKQLEAIKRVKDNLIASLDTLTNWNMIQAVQQRFEDAQVEYNRLQADLSSIDLEAKQLEQIYSLKDTCGPLLENWPNMTRSEKRRVLTAFIDRIEAMPVEGHGLHLVICWKDKKSSEITLPRQATIGNNWLPEQVELLFELVRTEASQIEIAREFPERKWQYIKGKYRKSGGGSEINRRPKPIKDVESYYDYLERTGKQDDTNSLLSMGSVTHSSMNSPSSATA